MLPTFETDRLIIRTRLISDLQACLSMDRDPHVTRFIPGPWADPKAHRAFIIDRINKTYPEGMGYWSVIERGAADRFAGWVMLVPYHSIADETEIGWRFIRESWGQGFATQSASLILQHAFATVGLQQIVADIHPQNVASTGVAEKLGMVRAEDRFIDGEPAKSYQVSANSFRSLYL